MRVDVVSASAGTGKTRKLTEELVAALDAGTARPEGVVAITYTTKAAGELESRIRSALLARGRAALAARVRDGYIGTIHAVCQRLLREFALEVGQSPWVEPIPESQRRRVFQEALALVLAGRQGALAPMARRLGIEDFTGDLGRIVDAARENGLGPGELLASRDRSRRGLLALLPPPALGREEYRRRFAEELAPVAAQLAALARTDGTDAARKRARLAAQLQAAVRRQGLPAWSDQVAVLKELSPVKLQPVAGSLLALVERHLECEELHADVAGIIDGLFEVTADALDAFDRAKRAARVVDFGDMLARAAELLRAPEVARALSARLDLVLVDEFQDTSPMQLAVVMGLGALARRSVWVGDRKQAIFSFQGSDPELMSAAMAYASEGRTPEILGESHRSRAPLVDLASEVFVRSLAVHGFREEEVRLAAARPDPATLAAQPAVELWAWSPEKKEEGDRRISAQEPFAVAAGVAELLASDTFVRERPGPGVEERIRPVAARDVGVLARRNADCVAIAAALRTRGIPALVALGGLTDTPEARLARSALALMADPSDGIAALDVSWLSGGARSDPDAWLGARLESVRAWRAAREEARVRGEPPPPGPAPFPEDPAVSALRALRSAARDLSPTEALDAAIRAVDLIALCRSWPAPETRLANLEALRGEARAYEELCRVRRSACTAAGLVEHLDGLDGERDSNRQGIPTADDAVTVSTWHGAKGLEWPVVVLATLDGARGPETFGVSVEAAAAFDAAAPLRDRWIRYWPWPYGKRSADLRLGPLADVSPEGLRVGLQHLRERLRLLYVGFTRARDLLVLEAQLAPRGEPRTAALDALVDAEGRPVLELPFGAGAGPAVVRAGGREWACRVRKLSGLPPTAAGAVTEPARRWYDFGARAPRPREILNPSAEPSPTSTAVRIVVVTPLSDRIPIRVPAALMGPLGDAVHGFLAADPGGGGDRAARRELAARLLTSHGVAGALDPEALLRTSEALAAHLSARFPGAAWRREWPVRARLDVEGHRRLLRAEVDLFLELEDGFVLVDHKSFPGGAAERDERVLGHASQLAWYARALRAALDKPLRAAFIHLPLRGELVEVEIGMG